MTSKQEKMLETLKVKIMEHDSYGRPEDHEYKEWEVEELECGDVMLTSVVGRKGDEGTLAEALCRVTRHHIIGKSGGVYFYRHNHETNAYWRKTGLTNVLIYGGNASQREYDNYKAKQARKAQAENK